jgi:hypothetical protein
MGFKLTTDGFIKAGFWSQVSLLFLVDWGALYVFRHTEDMPWYHWVGFTMMNVILIYATWVMWQWLAPQKSKPMFTPKSAIEGAGEE